MKSLPHSIVLTFFQVHKLLDACLNGGGDLFKEIKSIRKTKQVVANTIDGVAEKMPDHFKDIYSGLYNSVDDA